MGAREVFARLIPAVAAFTKATLASLEYQERGSAFSSQMMDYFRAFWFHVAILKLSEFEDASWVRQQWVHGAAVLCLVSARREFVPALALTCMFFFSVCIRACAFLHVSPSMSLPCPSLHLSLSLSLSRPILTFRFFFCLKASLLSDIALYSPVLVDEKAKHYLKAKLASSVQYMEDKCDARELASLQTRLQKVLAASHAHSPDVHRLDFGTTLFALAVYELEVRLFVPVSLCVRACACVCVCVSWPSMQQLNSALLSFGLFFFSNSRPCPSPPPKKKQFVAAVVVAVAVCSPSSVASALSPRGKFL